MPHGQFYFGQQGFFFKKNGGGGNHRVLALGLNCNQPQDINNKYVYGSGVGSHSTAQRRHMKRHASLCVGKCEFDYFYLNSIPLGVNNSKCGIVKIEDIALFIQVVNSSYLQNMIQDYPIPFEFKNTRNYNLWILKKNTTIPPCQTLHIVKGNILLVLNHDLNNEGTIINDEVLIINNGNLNNNSGGKANNNETLIVSKSGNIKNNLGGSFTNTNNILLLYNSKLSSCGSGTLDNYDLFINDGTIINYGYQIWNSKDGKGNFINKGIMFNDTGDYLSSFIVNYKTFSNFGKILCTNDKKYSFNIVNKNKFTMRVLFV
jgi:hypothetical protein